MESTVVAERFELVVGIETHVQLKTRSKMFCGCSTEFGAPPNSQVCPICMGHPGVLPVINREAVDRAMLAALALGCRVAEFTKFDRKNYFYPDLPKNYQISQYDLPLAKEGALEFDVKGREEPARVRIERVHMEEDAGKLQHGEDRSYVDLNRCGVPLIEVVTRPDLRSAEEAASYMNALRSLMRATRVSDCDMEKGEFRCDVNVSVRPKGSEKLGTKVEIKNLNSFKFAADAIRYEFARQAKAIERGERIVQETRLFDPDRGATASMRVKEGVSDYRYFPEPDLPPLRLSAEQIEAVRRKLPELPMARKRRLISQYGLAAYDAAILVSDLALADLFEQAVQRGSPGKAKATANWVINEVLKVMNEKKIDSSNLAPVELVALLKMLEDGRVTANSAKEMLAELMTRPGMTAEQAARGREQVSDAGVIDAAVERAIRENPKAVADYKGGKEAAEKFLIGCVMKITKGRANVQAASELLRKKLG